MNIDAKRVLTSKARPRQRRRAFVLLCIVLVLLSTLAGCGFGMRNAGAEIPETGIYESTAMTADSADPADVKETKESSILPVTELAEDTTVTAPESVMDLEQYLSVVDPYVSYDSSRTSKDAISLAEAYPEWIQSGSIGQSVLGKELTLIKLGKGPTRILWCGSHHAREHISSTALMAMAEAYAKLAQEGTMHAGMDARALLEQVTVWIVPMVNPDGVDLAIHGLDALPVETAALVSDMKMLRKTYSEWKSNINGVDLNRQYPVLWDEKTDTAGEPASEMYKGLAPATEPEVQAMMALCKAQEFLSASSFHTKGEVLYWADSGTVGKIAAATNMAKEICALTGYKKMPISKYPADYAAGFENWFRAEFEKPAFCVELTPSNGNDRPQDNQKFDALVWEKVHALGLYLMEAAIR